MVYLNLVSYYYIQNQLCQPTNAQLGKETFKIMLLFPKLCQAKIWLFINKLVSSVDKSPNNGKLYTLSKKSQSQTVSYQISRLHLTRCVNIATLSWQHWSVFPRSWIFSNKPDFETNSGWSVSVKKNCCVGFVGLCAWHELAIWQPRYWIPENKFRGCLTIHAEEPQFVHFNT